MRYNKNCIGYQNKNSIKLMLKKKELNIDNKIKDTNKKFLIRKKYLEHKPQLQLLKVDVYILVYSDLEKPTKQQQLVPSR
jgi:hypothetical protein